MDLYIAVSPVPEHGHWQAALVPPAEASDPTRAVRDITTRADITALQQEWNVAEVRYADEMEPEDIPAG